MKIRKLLASVGVAMALVIAVLAWLYPARTIRSQVLTLKELAAATGSSEESTGIR